MNKLILVGLGNDDSSYQKTRHNVGVMFLDFLAIKNDSKWINSANCWWTTIIIDDKKLTLIKLHAWMNVSGVVLKKVLTKLNLELSETFICVDNIDLSFGKIKLGSYLPNNGHKGIKNIRDIFRTKNIATLHIGVDKNIPVDSWVLSEFSITEQEKLQEQTFPQLTKRLLKSYQNSTDKEILINNFHKQGKTQKSKHRHLAIVGGQWGDEGKGKIVDYFATQNYPIVARFSGGDNAGHTIKIQKKTYQFSILPVSIIQPEVVSIIGRGCLINLKKLVEELENLQKNQNKINLQISPFAHVILPYHLLMDELQEQKRQKNKIGTTKRGIGPCLEDKAGRFGIQILDLFDVNNFTKKLQEILETKNAIFTKIYQHTALKWKDILNEQLMLFTKIKKYVTNVWEFCQTNQKQAILFEGAQGTLLDINFGTYPFVTSSSTITWQIGNSFGNLCHQTKFMGVFKAYSTRVGAGPIWTEFLNEKEIGEQIAIKGNEFGVVTKRKRRIGWFDAIFARYACQVNGFHQIALTMLDVLGGFDKIKICVAYKNNDQTMISFPFQQNYEKLDCEYIVLNGWKEDISHMTNYQELPINAKKYVEKIEELLKTSITLISVGPERNQVIWKNQTK